VQDSVADVGVHAGSSATDGMYWRFVVIGTLV